MTCKKELKDISLDITEQEYRDMPCLHYSALSKFAKEGFNAIDKLDEKIETPSLVFGSLVDTIITEGIQAVTDKYVVVKECAVSDVLKGILNDLYHNTKAVRLSLIYKEYVIAECRRKGYRNNYKDDTLYSYILKEGSDYYEYIRMSDGKVVVDSDTYAKAFKVAETLYSEKSTSFIFGNNDLFNEDIKRYYQLKFKSEIAGTEFKCMLDLILVNYKTKEIVPIDLKTTSMKEWEFPSNFKKYRYDIQAKCYYKVLSDVCAKDEYFKDFKILPFRFVVINKDSLTPLIWVYNNCTEINNWEINGNSRLEAPTQLINMLNNSIGRRVPMNINETGSNEITDFLYE